MKKSLQVFIFVLACSTAFLLAQSPNSGSSAPGGSMGSTPSAQTGNPGGPPANPSSNPDMTNPPSTSQTASQQPKVDDDTLHRQVHEQLATNPDLQNVDISVSNGKVSLTGSVPNKSDKKEAKKLAKSVPGVMGVKDDLTISASNAAAGSSSVGTSAGSNSTTGVSGSSPSSSSPSSGSMNENPPTTANPNNTPNASPSTPPSNPPQQNFMHNNFMGEQSSSQSSTTTDQSSAPSSTSPSATPNPPAADQSQAPAGSQSSSPSASTSPSSSSPSATDQSGSSAAIGSPAGQTASTTGAGESSDQVKTDIQTAFHNEPTLTSSGVSVDVSADSITLNGSVPSQKDRDEAKRIAQSFAGNRKVVDNVKVSGTGSSTSDVAPNPNPAPDTGMQQNQSNPEQPSVPKK